jgi:hypothetical protein
VAAVVAFFPAVSLSNYPETPASERDQVPLLRLRKARPTPANTSAANTIPSRPKLKAVNPLTYLTNDAPPFFIMNGDKDDIVPVQESKALADALANAIGPKNVAYYVIRGGSHGGPAFENPSNLATVFTFLHDQIGTPGHADQMKRKANSCAGGDREQAACSRRGSIYCTYRTGATTWAAAPAFLVLFSALTALLPAYFYFLAACFFGIKTLIPVIIRTLQSQFHRQALGGHLVHPDTGRHLESAFHRTAGHTVRSRHGTLSAKGPALLHKAVPGILVAKTKTREYSLAPIPRPA